MSAFDYMARFEEDCLRFFELLGETADSGERKTLYALLLDNQKHHLADLRALRDTYGDGAAESPLAARAENLVNRFRLTMLSPDIRKALKNDKDAFDHVLLAEEEVIRLFEGMARAESRTDSREVLRQIAEDEKRHQERIEEIYEFVETPRCYLEWGEFSNLKPL
jgi:rubrerythrin